MLVENLARFCRHTLLDSFRLVELASCAQKLLQELWDGLIDVLLILILLLKLGSQLLTKLIILRTIYPHFVEPFVALVYHTLQEVIDYAYIFPGCDERIHKYFRILILNGRVVQFLSEEIV